MKLLKQFLIILAICLSGEIIHKLTGIPMPGNVIGMILLFICLCTGLIKLQMIEEAGKFLLDHLAFFFVPAGVGLLASMGLLKEHWLPFLAVCLLVTVLVMIVTGYTVQLLMKRRQSR